MTDFAEIIPADLLPEAVEEFEHVRDCHDWYQDHNERMWAERAIAAALELAESLMVCGTCKSLRDEDHYCELAQHRHPMLHEERCKFSPSRWQHYREGSE